MTDGSQDPPGFAAETSRPRAAHARCSIESPARLEAAPLPTAGARDRSRDAPAGLHPARQSPFGTAASSSFSVISILPPVGASFLTAAHANREIARGKPVGPRKSVFRAMRLSLMCGMSCAGQTPAPKVGSRSVPDSGLCANGKQPYRMKAVAINRKVRPDAANELKCCSGSLRR